MDTLVDIDQEDPPQLPQPDQPYQKCLQCFDLLKSDIFSLLGGPHEILLIGTIAKLGLSLLWISRGTSQAAI